MARQLLSLKVSRATERAADLEQRSVLTVVTKARVILMMELFPGKTGMCGLVGFYTDRMLLGQFICKYSSWCNSVLKL